MSTELDRGAVMCGPSGAVAFPHQPLGCSWSDRWICPEGSGLPRGYLFFLVGVSRLNSLDLEGKAQLLTCKSGCTVSRIY